MGVRHTVIADDTVYSVVDDQTSRYQCVFTSTLLDEITGAPVSGVSTLSGGLPGVLLRVAENALVSGAADIVKSFPGLATQPYSMTVSVLSDGYRSTSFPVNLPAGSNLPVQAPAVALRRIPVRLQGRVANAVTGAPVADAIVSSHSPNLFLLRTVARMAHAAGTTVHLRSFAASGIAHALAASAGVGDTVLALDDNAGMAAGDHLQLGAAGAEEIYEIAAIGPGAGSVTLQTPLVSSFAKASVVQLLTASAPSATATLTRRCDAGDGILLFTSGSTDTAIEVSDGTATECHWLNAVSNVGGAYSVNGIAVEYIELAVSGDDLSTALQPWFPQYDEYVNVVNFQMKP